MELQLLFVIAVVLLMELQSSFVIAAVLLMELQLLLGSSLTGGVTVAVSHCGVPFLPQAACRDGVVFLFQI